MKPKAKPVKDSREEAVLEVARKHLLGAKIINVRYMTAGEAAEFGWDNCPVVFELDSGAFYWPSRDDEGNDAGALHGSYAGSPITLPVLRRRR